MDNKLLPCPFCGKNSAYVLDSYSIDKDSYSIDDDSYSIEKTRWVVTCAYCNVATPVFDSRNEAICLWNTRVERNCGAKVVGE